MADAAGRRWALRRPPLGKRLASAHDMAREHRIISALQETEVPVPPIVGLCEDESVNGAPFYVMEFVEGPILRSRKEAEGSFDEAERGPIGERVVDTLVAIHAVDPDRVGLGELGKKQDYVARQLHRWHGQWEKSKTRELPLIDDVHRRLSERIPEQGPATIVHGDYRLDNMILTDAGEVAAVVDWELCTLGDPLADVGMLIVYWSEAGDELMPLFEAPTTAAGFPIARARSASATPSAPAATSRRSTSTSRSAGGSWRSSSRASTPATRPASTASPTRASSEFAEIVERLAGGGRRGRAPPSERAASTASGSGLRRGRVRALGGAGAVGARASSASFAQRCSSRRAITILWTSSGPSATRSMRLKRHIQASGVSSDIPSAPWTWIARSSTSMTTFAATTLIIEISCRAARLPSVSICQAALRVSSRAWSTSMRDRATKSWTNCFSASLPPNVSRSLARRHISSIARSAVPIARMQWWMRPGPEPVLGDHEAGAPLAEQARGRHAAVLVADLAVAGAAGMAHHRDRSDQVEAGVVGGDEDHARPRVGVGVGIGDAHDDRHRGAHGARGEPLVAVDHPLVAVELGAGLERGRVGARDLGLGHREAAADLAVQQRLEPFLALLLRAVLGEDLHVAVSGAEQLKAIGATAGLRPISSQSTPYSQFPRPAP